MAQLVPGTDTQSHPPIHGPRPARTWLHGRLAAWAALLVVWVVWGSTYLAIRVADRTIPPFPMAAARYLIAGAMLYSVAWLGGRRQRRALGSPARTRRGSSPGWLAQWAGMAVVGTMLLAFGNGGVSYAERTLPSGLAALLVASVPLWMALADWVINGHRIRLGGWLALAIGLAGVAVLAKPPAHGPVFPVLVVLGASMSWGIGSVLAGRMPSPASPLLGSAMEMLAGGAALIVLASATGELTRAASSHVSVQSLLAVAYLIGPGSLLAMTCYVIALRRLPTSAVSTYAYVNPVVAVSLGALILGERPTSTTLLGGAIVVVSVALLLTHQAGTARNPHPPDPEPRASAPAAREDTRVMARIWRGAVRAATRRIHSS